MGVTALGWEIREDLGGGLEPEEGGVCGEEGPQFIYLYVFIY